MLKREDTDYLEFDFGRGDIKIVNINDSTDNSELKSVFNKVIAMALNEDVELASLEVDESIGGGLLADVFTEYVTDLNSEISRIRAELRIELDENEA